MILLRLFKNDRMAGMAGLFFLTLALFIKPIILAEEVTSYHAMPFYNLIFGYVHNTPILNHIIAMSLMILLGYMLIRIGARYVLLEVRSFMPALFFMAFSATLPQAQEVSPALIGSIFFLLSFAILFDVNDKPADTYAVFNAGLILALGSMFYLKLIWFLPLIWISLGTLRNVTWRELFYPLIAFTLMGLFLFTWYWAIMDNVTQLMDIITENLAFDRSYKNVFQSYHLSVFIFYGFILLLVVMASIYMINRFQSRKTVVQNIYQVLFYMFIAGLLYFTLVSRFDPTTLLFISFPVSFILTYFIHRKRNTWIHEIIMWIMIGLMIFVQWMS